MTIIPKLNTQIITQVLHYIPSDWKQLLQISMGLSVDVWLVCQGSLQAFGWHRKLHSLRLLTSAHRMKTCPRALLQIAEKKRTVNIAAAAAADKSVFMNKKYTKLATYSRYPTLTGSITPQKGMVYYCRNVTLESEHLDTSTQREQSRGQQVV